MNIKDIFDFLKVDMKFLHIVLKISEKEANYLLQNPQNFTFKQADDIARFLRVKFIDISDAIRNTQTYIPYYYDKADKPSKILSPLKEQEIKNRNKPPTLNLNNMNVRITQPFIRKKYKKNNTN